MTHVRVPRLTIVLALVATTLTTTALTDRRQADAADAQVTLTLVIEAVRALDDLDDLDGADFYPQVQLAGTSHGGASLEITDDDDIQPDWRFSTSVRLPSAATTAAIHLELYDADGAFNGPRDHVDVTDSDADRNLDLVVDLTSCALGEPGTPISGDVTGRCGDGLVSSGSASDRASMRFQVLVDAPDSDGDGLLDAWETLGYDSDGNGLVDVNLPALGADPNHKDLFLELDATAASTLDREDVLAMTKAFAAAPVESGTKASELPGGKDAKPNPDGRRGITLHVDTGTRVDASAREGQPLDTCANGIDDAGDGVADAADPDCSGPGEYLDASTEDPQAPNCTDGIDNDGDGSADVADRDCLLGENLGGGDVVAAPSPPACNLDASFYAVKASAFSPVRARMFRWALSLALDPSCPPSGGWGERGGNDFMDFNFDGGTVMHELGHTLNLDHGGFEGSNCKPNYLSGMNYDNQFAVRRAGGGSILDFSPPRRALDGSSRAVVAPDIDEAALDERSVFDPADALNRFVYVDSTGAKRTARQDANPNYNNDTDPPLDFGFAGNVDTSDGAGNPSDCTNATSATKLVSQNDWLRISLPFRQFGDSADGPVNPPVGPELTSTQLRRLEDSINATDLSVLKTGPTAAVAAGTTATYRVTVTNQGPNPAPAVTVVDTLPAGTSYVADTGACQRPTAATLSCGLGEILPGASRAFDVTVLVQADLVHLNGSPLTITNTASGSAARGVDLDRTDDTATAASRVVAVADLSLSAALVSPPRELVIGQPVTLVVSSTTSNAGPSSPMDARVTTTAAASSGASASPASQGRVVTAVAIGAPRTTTQDVTIACSAPGEHLFTMQTSVSPSRVDDTDPVPSNNSATVTLTVDCVVPVAINIKPGQDPNSINRTTSSDVPVAVLTTRAGEYGLPLAFDASTIQPSTVRFGPIGTVNAGAGSPETHGKNHLERSYELDERTVDADRDGVLHFDPARAGLLLSTVEGCVKGSFTGPAGQRWTFLGCGPVAIVR
jgi:uncharacterized repeat protein (TIGR01451 family)